MNELVTQDNISQVRQAAVAKLRGERPVEPSAAEQPPAGLDEQSRRIQDLLAKIETLPDPSARALAQESLHAVMTLYGGGLARILQILAKRGPAAQASPASCCMTVSCAAC